MRRWLVKSEPEVFSIDDLRKCGSTSWDGVRNYQARNYLIEMSPGDLVLIYHSNSQPSGVAGVAVVERRAEPDKTQFDKKSEYFDPKSDPAKPRWFCPRLSFKLKFSQLVTLEQLRAEPLCSKMELLRRGSRLSVQPVEERVFKKIVSLGTA